MGYHWCMRICCRCGEAKPDDEFYRDRRSVTGLTAACRTCLLQEKWETRERLKARSDEEVEAAAAAKGSKRCAACGEVQSTADFARDRGRPDGRGIHCLECAAAKTRADTRLRPDIYRLRKKADYGRNRERYRKDQLKAKFGITPEQYQAMHDAQQGVCAICGEPETRVRSGRLCTLAVDHDHVTGAVRDLLCNRCNTGLGWFQDRADLLRRAALYVENHKEVQQRESPPA